MRRGFAVSWHALSFLLVAVLFFLFVLPRWWEMMGDVSHSFGTTARIVTGALLGLTALPVVFTLIRTRRPEFGTPQLALSLRLWSIVAHLVAAVLIIGTAIAEIWLSLDNTGQWLFGVYGGAAAISILGALAFYLAFVAELPPPPPKPLKPKKSRATASTIVDASEADVVTEEAETTEAATESDATEDEKVDVSAEAEPAEADEVEDQADKTAPARLRNRRPSGKTRAST
jgi:hypothetical protein